MEAASPKPLEPLPDLPVEEPLDVPKPRAEAAAPAAPAAPAASGGDEPPPAAAVATPEDSSPTDLNFIDPEMFLAPGQQPTAVPVGSEASATKETDIEFELELEDPVVDEILTAPPAPVPVASPAPAPAAAPASGESAADKTSARAAARV